MGRRSRIAATLTLVFVALVAAGFILLFTLDFNAFKGAISDAVRDATGRELSIAGDVALSRSLPPTLSISDVTFANAPWGARSPMVSVGELRVQVALLPLLKRELVFNRLELSGTTVFLETDAKGRGNWELEPASAPRTGGRSMRGVQLRHVHINDLNFNFRNGQSGWKTQYELASLAVERPPAAKQASVALNGVWQGQPVALAGHVGRLVDAQAGKPFAVDLSGEVAGGTIALTGDIADLFNLTGFDLKIEASGTDLTRLAAVADIKLPETNSYDLTARLQGSRQALQATEVKGTARSADVSFDFSGTIGNLTALADIALQLQLSGSDLSRLGPMIDATLAKFGPFSASGRLTGSGEELSFQDARVKLSRGELSIRLAGDINDVIGGSGVDLSLEAAGANLAEFGEVIFNQLPDTGAFDISGRLTGSFGKLALADASAKLNWRGVSLTASGAVAHLEALGGIDLKATAAGDEFAELSPLIGRELPKLGSFKVTGDLTGSAVELVLGNAFALVGHSDFDGTVRVALDDGPKVTVRLNSGLIDYTPFMAAVKENERGHRESEQRAKGAPLFSDQSLGLDALGKFDADVILHMRRIRARDAEFEFGHLVLSLINGKLDISTFEATYRGARISGRAQVDLESSPRLKTDFLVQGFDLGHFLAETHTSEEVEGHLDIAVEVNSRGDSTEALMANLDGSVALVMGKGRASRYLDLLAENLSTRVFRIWGQRKEAARVECGVVQFDIDQGVATSRAFVFVTERTIVTAEGDINLATEHINFLLKPIPRHISLFSLATNLRVTGTLTAPEVRPDILALAEKGGKLLSALVIGPLGLLAPFVHLGAHDKHPCDIKAIDEKLLATPEMREDAAETGSPR